MAFARSEWRNQASRWVLPPGQSCDDVRPEDIIALALLGAAVSLPLAFYFWRRRRRAVRRAEAIRWQAWATRNDVEWIGSDLNVRPSASAPVVVAAGDPQIRFRADHLVQGTIKATRFEAWELVGPRIMRVVTFGGSARHRIVAVDMPVPSPGVHIDTVRRFGRFKTRGGVSRFEWHAFNKTFRVASPNPRFASAVLHSRVMELVASAGTKSVWDWTGTVLLVSVPGKATPDNLLALLPASLAFRDLVPGFLAVEATRDEATARARMDRLELLQASLRGFHLGRRLSWGFVALCVAGLVAVALYRDSMPAAGTAPDWNPWAAILPTLGVLAGIVAALTFKGKANEVERIAGADLQRLQ